VANGGDSERDGAQPAGWAALAGDLWQPRNPLLLELGPGGELLASRVRVVGLWLLLFAISALPLPPGTRGTHLAVAAAALGAALVAHAVVSWTYRPWLSFVTAALDVLTAGAFADLARVHAVDATHATLSLLLTALALAAARHDARVVVEAGVLGALVLVRLPGPRPAPLALLALATALLAVTLARARRHHAPHGGDPLTGLLRREPFEQWLRAEIHRSRRHAHSLTLALLEVDRFQDLAARHGAARGMAVQRSIAAILRRSLRGTDVVARQGSGLFALALPETDARVALPRLETLRRSITAASRGGVEDGAAAAVLVSVGVAAWPDDGDDAARLVAVAEERLRGARDAGGDRLIGPP
jgi:diguanylate cyclase (GGDEF)-like protein